MVRHNSFPTELRSSSPLNTSLPIKRILVSFLVAVAAIASLVLYYSLAEATIVLKIKPDNAVTETKVTIGEKNSDVFGVIKSLELSDTKVFPASPSGEREDKATGTVNLINKYSANQTLIATTRLATPEGILFRLKQTVTVPAGGKVETSVVADQAGETSEVGPTKFTIPGLKPTLRELIFAESTVAMRRLEKPGTKVTALDFEQANKVLADALIPQAVAKLREQLPNEQKSWSVVYKADTLKGEADKKEGEQSADFNYAVTVKVSAVFYDPVALRDKMLNKSQDLMKDGRKIITIEEQSLAVTLDTINTDSNLATLNIKFLAQVTVTDANKAFKKTDLLGRTPAEVSNYFDLVPGVESATTKLWPFWVKTVPTVESHITLEVQE